MSTGIGLLDSAPYPQNDPLVFVNKQGEGFVNEQQWGNWLLALQNNVNAAPARVGNQVNLSGIVAAIPASDLNADALNAGVYRVSYQLRCSLAAGVSSAAQITVVWTQGGVTQTFTGSNVNGNTTTSRDSDTLIIRPDAGTPVTYALSYASNPAAVAQFELDVIFERTQVTGS